MAQDIDASRAKLIQDFNAVIADTEELLRALAATGAEKSGALRASAEENLKTAKLRLAALQDDALDNARAAVQATDEYVRKNPWESIGIAAGLAALVGFALGLLLNRR
jgi:ElaB/YqjD/DUF883 family membrane-anchored ribosome-binding protein